MTTTTVPAWTLKGDWFDVCTCNVPCPCTFAQAPTNNKCTAMFAYRITEGAYGDVDLAGLNVGCLVDLVGNIWDAETKCTVGLMVDDRATPEQMEALGAIFGGAAGGWPAAFATKIGDFRGVEVVPMRIEIAEDLSSWGIEVSGRYTASAAALTGPTADPTKRVQVMNAPGSETGPKTNVATYAVGDLQAGEWTALGLACYVAAVLIEAATPDSLWFGDSVARIAGAAIVGAGVFQFSTLKDRCLTECRSPLAFIAQHWRDGRFGAVQLGVRHGVTCVGCCWALMLTLFPIGMSNIAAMAAVSALILAERVFPNGAALGRLAGIALLVYGLAVLVHPGLLPGPPGHDMAGMNMS